jgi:hypothetical protein
MKIGPLVALSAVAVLVAGCGGSTPAPSGDAGPVQVAPASPGATELPSKATMRAYFDGVAKATLASYDRAVAAALPGSPAAGFVTYLRAAAQAVVDSGQELEADDATAVVKDGGYEFCNGSSSSRTCFRYSDITGDQGKVADFSVNGKPVADRVAVGAGTPVRLATVDATAAFVVAFESSAGDNLFVAVKVDSGNQALETVEAAYRPATGARVESARMSGPSKLAAGEAGSYVFAFPGARIGGTLTLTAHAVASVATADLRVTR